MANDLTIRLINQTNKGVSSARNNGIKQANGQYLCFCDVDDQVTENYLSLMVKHAEENDLDLIVCRYDKIRCLTPFNKIENNIEKIDIFKTETFLKKYLYGDVIIGVGNTLIHRRIIKENEIFFKEGYKYNEDLHLMWRVIFYSKKIGYIQNKLYLYFYRPGSTMTIFNENRLDGYYLMKELEEFFERSSLEFYKEYKKYAAAKIIWSITWQAAVYLKKTEFNMFINKYYVAKYMQVLIRFKNTKVRGSAAIYLISTDLFRLLARFIGRRYIH